MSKLVLSLYLFRGDLSASSPPTAISTAISMSKAVPIRPPDAAPSPSTPTTPKSQTAVPIKASTPAFVPSAAALAATHTTHTTQSPTKTASPSGFAATAPVFIPKTSSPYDEQGDEEATAPTGAQWEWSGMDSELSGIYDNSTSYPRHPLQYHLYVPPPPYKLIHNVNLSQFFLHQDTHKAITEAHESQLRAPPPGLRLPERLHVYRDLYPLDEGIGPGVGLASYPTYVYRATSERDGARYALRRVEGFRLTSQEPLSVVDRWRRLRHPHVVPLIEAFSTRSFHDSSLILVHAYYANAKTLGSIHQANALNPHPPPLVEHTLWLYLVQIVHAVMHIHTQGLAVRCINPSRVLVTGKNRLRLNCVGAMDVLLYDDFANVHTHQQEDLSAVGTLLLTLALGNSSTVTANPTKAMEFFSRQYGPDLQRIVLWLLGNRSPLKTAQELWGMVLKIKPAVVAELLDASVSAGDTLTDELAKEVENGRLVRLLCKFGFINERAEFDLDSRWSETGDRYIIKLFRDYVFHQVDEHGKPVLDMSHVLVCLNKLDAGVDESLMLISRDEQSCLVVSYKEVKQCIESAFGDLKRETGV
ncbi:hypothetical protein E3P81_00253 [Wallemia ichthyophaga]|nr:hypothetical protein E3P97_00255 [Wallemia ichthyophaga]TIA98836.1 hypothetical protein E3P96_03054 [Wallemia ichthyophaga]TIB35951.1 hypothetical protein E3P85_00216 [Wallemia ichthyophaga]TIB50946.1 hypothetical protein E3P82_00255 [Wallemia ichthyophaga]TIB54392.1 hypothetical protein E3P81_00253 [Wallemia ichthyophaga]